MNLTKLPTAKTIAIMKPDRTNIQIRLNVASTGTARTETMDGSDYHVIPAVMLVEGVLNGVVDGEADTDGLLYPGSEIQKIPEAWNGRPVCVRHPEESANLPELMDTQNIGWIYNSKAGKKTDGRITLKSELWINLEKARNLGFDDVADQLEDPNSEVMEVSTGLLMDIANVSGTYNGKGYAGIAINYRPDHLALLPDEVGACSVEDGCGAYRKNQKSANCNGECQCGGKCKTGNESNKGTEAMNDNKKGWAKLISGLAKAAGMKPGEVETMLTGSNELSVDDLREQIRTLAKNSNTDKDCYVYVMDIFPDSKRFVAEFYKNSKSKYYMQGYSVANDIVSLNGQPQEVIRQTIYTPIATAESTGMNSSAEIADGKQAKETENPTMRKNEDGSFNFSAEEAAEFEALKAGNADELETLRKAALNANPALTIEMVSNISDKATLTAMAKVGNADSTDGNSSDGNSTDGNGGESESNGSENDSGNESNSDSETDGNSSESESSESTGTDSTDGSTGSNAKGKNADYSARGGGGTDNSKTANSKVSKAPAIFTANKEDREKYFGKAA